MKDRVSRNPGAYKAIIMAGSIEALQNSEEFEIFLERDDDPEVVGTPYNKESVLPDDVADALCPHIEDPTPADAFRALHECAISLDVSIHDTKKDVNTLTERVDKLGVSGGGVTQDQLTEAMTDAKQFAEGYTNLKVDELENYVDDKINDVTPEQIGAVKEEELAGKVATIIEDDYNSGGPIYETMDTVAQVAAEYYSEQEIATAIIDRRLVGHDPHTNRLIYEAEQDTYTQVTPEQVGAASREEHAELAADVENIKEKLDNLDSSGGHSAYTAFDTIVTTEVQKNIIFDGLNHGNFALFVETPADSDLAGKCTINYYKNGEKVWAPTVQNAISASGATHFAVYGRNENGLGFLEFTNATTASTTTQKYVNRAPFFVDGSTLFTKVSLSASNGFPIGTKVELWCMEDPDPGGGGGDYVEGVEYVTFMSDDGTTELYKKPVFAGDHCMNPVEMGWLDAPTKESSNTEVYTYDGWSLTSEGSADNSALLNVNEDRTVYAAFEASTRYYTVRFFDGDTLLHTAYAEYGSTPSYTPEKDGYYFNSWNPAPDNIVADLDCYAVWDEKLTFANGSWEKISEVCEAGQASEYFAVGDTKDFTDDTGAYTFTARIIGIDMDAKSDGSGKAGLSIMVVSNPVEIKSIFASGATMVWLDSDLRTYLNDTYMQTYLPTELQSVIKPVIKHTNGDIAYIDPEKVQTNDVIWVPSLYEASLGNTDGDSMKEPYPGLNTATLRIIGSEYWWLRSTQGWNSAPWDDWSASCVDLNGKLMRTSRTAECIVHACFCI